MAFREPPVQFNIDLGELEEAIQGTLAIAEGFAGDASVDDMGPQALQKLRKEFGKRADLLGAGEGPGSIAHTYEWGMKGRPEGRLWAINAMGTGKRKTLSFFFKNSQEYVPLSDIERQDAQERGFERATHQWARMAEDQEYTRVFDLTAGGPAPTRVSEGTSQYLLIYDNHGNPMYRKTWKNYSPYVGNFRQFFETFWNTVPEQMLEQEAERYLETKFKNAVEREVQSRVTSARRIPAMRSMSNSPINVTVKGVRRTISSVPQKRVIRTTRQIMKGMFK